MAKVPAKNELNKPAASVNPPEPLFQFRRISGKHHIRTPKGMQVITPGMVVTAPEGTYHGNQWECLGPVNPEPRVAKSPERVPKIEGFKKEQRDDGWYAIHPVTGKAINELPLTEAEVDILVNTTLERA